ncbi:transmembrane protein 143-like isoform X2 [Dendronephthya gigantea]|uniref:transmembrane protein 143-like isoform X2 n=1 Tax=Dendronephthya gigantea TaxID=151771 RepID=UPI00106C82C3|nr:transmembrane protein 143-like isoform X2 [Dendronephthya gigantea]
MFVFKKGSKWTQKLEAATSKISNNYSTPNDSPQKLTRQQEESDSSKYHIRHNYIPMTRKSLAKRIMEEETLISPEDHARFHEFAVAVDHAVGRLYHGVLGELKSLYDPLNPDKETLVTRYIGTKERQDREYLLLQKLNNVLYKAGFYELPQEAVQQALKEHDIGDGVLVKVDPSKYEILRFWVVGKDMQDDDKALGWARKARKSVRYQVYGRPSTRERYKRVIIAVRAKNQRKLILKTFKDIPCPNLEHLLPEGKIEMTRFDQVLVGVSLSIGLTTAVVKLITLMADHQVGWLPIATVTTMVLLARTWSVYKSRRNKYLADLTQTLYFKSMANNRALLTLVIDRAEDEAYKSAMLAYSFIRASRRLSLSEESPSDEEYTDGITKEELRAQIEGWMENKFGLQIKFDPNDCIHFLEDVGILTKAEEGDIEMLRVLPINDCLPLIPVPRDWHSPIDKTDEFDLHEVRAFGENEVDHQKEMETENDVQRKMGWY